MKISEARKIAADVEVSRRVRGSLDDFIKAQVISSLGSPDDLIQVQIQPVGTDRYRANVFVGKGANCARIANSFYLSTNHDGTIVKSSPEIVRLY